MISWWITLRKRTNIKQIWGSFISVYLWYEPISTQLTFSCSKSTKGYFTYFSSVSIVDFEQVNVSWGGNSWNSTQLTFTCSKSTTETLQKGVKYVQSNHKDDRTRSRRSGVFNVNCEHLSHLSQAFLLLNLNKQLLAGYEHYNPENYTRHDNFFAAEQQGKRIHLLKMNTNDI